MEINIPESEMVDTAVEMVNDLRAENETLLKTAETFKAEVDRLNTILLQESINKTQGSEVKRILLLHLSKMLDEHEEIFGRTGQFESVEFANDYIEAAKAAKFLGRNIDRIEDVQEWVNSPDSLPFD
jgi:hypothetical protein